MNYRSTFSGFSVTDIDEAKEFYTQILGLEVETVPEGLQLKLKGGQNVFVYPKPNHEPATYTILNFEVPDIEATVDELTAKGVVFEQYDNEWMKTDEKGICHGEPVIAWFKDPAGNFMSLIQIDS